MNISIFVLKSVIHFNSATFSLPKCSQSNFKYFITDSLYLQKKKFQYISTKYLQFC